MKRIFVFILAAVLLVGAVPAKVVRAEEYMTLFEALDSLGISYSEDMDGYSIFSFNYFMFVKVLNTTGDYQGYLLISNNVPVNIKTVNGKPSFCYTSTALMQGSVPGGLFYWNINNGTLKFEAGGYGKFLDTNNPGQHYVCYANYDTSFLSNSPFYADVENDQLEEHFCSWIYKEESATCTTSGKTWEECECGAIQNEVEIPALGHTWEQKEESGSCIEDSRTWEECSVCGEIQNEVVTPASGHVWIYKEEPATCTSIGRSWEECGCGEIQNEVDISLINHDDLLYEVIQEPSLTQEGIFIKSCSMCGELVETGSLPMLTPTPTPTPTLTPSPELVDNTADFSFVVLMVMLLMKDFPLNLFLVALLLCAGLVIFDDCKRGLNRK